MHSQIDWIWCCLREAECSCAQLKAGGQVAPNCLQKEVVLAERIFLCNAGLQCPLLASAKTLLDLKVGSGFWCRWNGTSCSKKRGVWEKHQDTQFSLAIHYVEGTWNAVFCVPGVKWSKHPKRLVDFGRKWHESGWLVWAKQNKSDHWFFLYPLKIKNSVCLLSHANFFFTKRTNPLPIVSSP